MDSHVNATWVFKSVASRIFDHYRKSHRGGGNGRQLADEDVSEVQRANPELVLLLHSRATLLPPQLKAYYDLKYGLRLRKSELPRQLDVSRVAVRHLGSSRPLSEDKRDMRSPSKKEF